MPINILDLPLELRNYIYHELWKHTPCLRIMESSKYGHITAEYSISVGAYYNVPSWLIACKQILAEASEQFRSRGRWAIDFDRNPSTRCPSILSPVEARSISVYFSTLQQRGTTQAGGTIVPSPRDSAMFTTLVEDIAATRTIRVLTINATAHFWPDTKILGFAIPGLRTNALKVLNLEKLIFDIEFCCSDLGDDIKSSFVAGIKVLGDRIFGTGGFFGIETRLGEPNDEGDGGSYWTFTREREAI